MNNFVTLNTRTTIAAVALVFDVVANLVFDITSATLDPNIAAAEGDLSAVGALGLSGLFLVLGLIVSAVLFLVWFNRAAWNLRALHPGASFQFTPGWCVGWFFVPFANLVKPFQAMKEVWTYSEPDTVNGGTNAFMPPPALLSTWWGLWIASNIASNVSARIPEASTAVGFIATLLSAGAAISLISIMRTIDANQKAAFELRRNAQPIIQDTLKHAADIADTRPY